MGRSNQRLLRSHCRHSGLSDISLLHIYSIAYLKMTFSLNIVHIYNQPGYLAIHLFERPNLGDFDFQQDLSKVLLGLDFGARRGGDNQQTLSF